jgi:ecdysone 20-monooxygenase
MLACNKDENFEDASVYRPERWLNENGEMNINQCESSSIVLPFGYGKRACPGKKYSEMELIMLTLKLVRTYKIEYVSPFEHQFEFVLAPKGPVNIKFSDRF